MRILCIGDSLGLPREGCEYENTWFYKLQKRYADVEFVDMFERSLLIKKACDNFDSYYSFYSSEVVIIQTGVCDCAPRYFNEKKATARIARSVLSRIGLSNFFWKVVKRKGRKPDCVYTPLTSFSIGFNTLLEKFLENGVKKIIVIKIGHAAESVLKRNPYFNSNVDIYNNEIEKICRAHNVVVIHPLHKVDDRLFVDGYHCNAQGMDIVFTSLTEEIEKYYDKCQTTNH